MDEAKTLVRDFWEAASCGEVYARGTSLEAQFEAHRHHRYTLEPYLKPFARFEDGKGQDVLEIGVGMGADHLEWARSGPRRLVGIDLTPRAVTWTRRRLEMYGIVPDVSVGDAESLAFKDESFDLVYSWGVLHHSPSPELAIREIYRVLRSGGTARIMVYNRWSIVGALLWMRYGLLRGKPFVGLTAVYREFLESPGTQAFTAREMRHMLRPLFSTVDLRTHVTAGDSLDGAVGQRHGGPALRIARRVWPRALVRRFGNRFGLALLVEATK